MQKVALKDQVCKSISKETLDGRFSVDSIINEKVLSEQFEVSRTPVREALVGLCSEGTLGNLPRYGYHLIPVTQNEIQEITEYRKVMEIGTLRPSLDYIGPADVQKLRRLDESTQEAVISRDIHLAWERNENFHREFGGLCPNQHSRSSIRDILTVGNRCANRYFSSIQREDRPLDRNHTKTIEALEGRGLAEAQEMLTLDIGLMKAILLQK